MVAKDMVKILITFMLVVLSTTKSFGSSNSLDITNVNPCVVDNYTISSGNSKYRFMMTCRVYKENGRDLMTEIYLLTSPRLTDNNNCHYISKQIGGDEGIDYYNESSNGKCPTVNNEDYLSLQYVKGVVNKDVFMTKIYALFKDINTRNINKLSFFDKWFCEHCVQFYEAVKRDGLQLRSINADGNKQIKASVIIGDKRWYLIIKDKNGHFEISKIISS